jgi:hypothetical protein
MGNEHERTRFFSCQDSGMMGELKVVGCGKRQLGKVCAEWNENGID